MIILIYFILLFIILLLLKNRSVVLLMLLTQIASLTGGFFIGSSYSIESFFSVFNLLITILFLSVIILPWVRAGNVVEIQMPNDAKLKRLTYFLIIVSIIPFIVFVTVSVFVSMFVEDINAFKYAEGVSTDFYYSLPINTKLLILSNYLYYYSYFLIPLHFYYLSKRKFKMAFWCLLFSLNIILHGLTFFSRSVFIQFILIYMAFLIMLFKTFNAAFKRFIKIAVVTVGVAFVSYFVYVSNQRFVEDKEYASLIPQNALVQDPVVYSYFDYLSQWYGNNMSVLDDYNFVTFGGQTSLSSVLTLIGQYGIGGFSSDAYLKLRMQLWPKHWYTFNGFVAYSVYDYGYTLTFIFLLFYAWVVIKNGPVNNRLTLIKMLILVLLIQLPLMAIFYSTVGEIVIPFILLIPIFIYLKIKLKNKSAPLTNDGAAI